MTTIINKVLAGQEDLAIGLGSEAQTRQNTSVTIQKIGLRWIFTAVSEIKALDVTKYTHVMLVSGASATNYYYDASSTATPDDINVIQPDVGGGRWLIQETATGVVGLISDLKAVVTNGLSTGDIRQVSGYNSIGDVDMLTFYWDASSIDSDNGVTIIIPTYPGFGGTGRWIRVWNGRSLTTGEAGAVGNGTTDDTTAVLNAYSVIEDVQGTLYVTGLHGMTADIDVIKPGVQITGLSRETTGFKALAGGFNLIHISADNCEVRDLVLSASFSGVSAIRMTPQDENQTSILVNQNDNIVKNINILGCDEGIVLQCGPDISGADSGCFYNSFMDITLLNTKRAVWLKDGPNPSSSGSNRNKFINIRLGSTALTANTGIQIDSGATNRFIDCDFEGLQNLTFPSLTPTAVVIKSSGLYSGDNNLNVFVNCMYEANTRDLDISNVQTCMINSGHADTKSVFTAPLLTNLGGPDASFQHQIGLGVGFQSDGNVVGWENNVVVLDRAKGIQFPDISVPSTASRVLDDYIEGTFTPTITATGGGTPIYSVQRGRYQKVGKFVKIWAEITLTSKGGITGNYLRIESIPYTSASTATLPVFTGSVRVVTGLTGLVAGTYITTAISLGQNAINFYKNDQNGDIGGLGLRGVDILDNFSTSIFIEYEVNE